MKMERTFRNRWVPAATLALLVSACADLTGPTSQTPGGGNVEIEENGAISASVAAALADNVASHEDAADYSWNAAAAVPVLLNGTSITAGQGATVDGGTVTISAPGTYRLKAEVIFTEPINDGFGDYEAGEYIYEYTVTVEEDAD